MIIAGNSHVSVFRNRLWKRRSNDPVKVKWVGAITAGHFVKNYSSTQVVRSIFFKTDDWKILSIGMHDMFLLCRAYSENRYEQIFDELISCYKKIFFELNSKGKFGWLISPQQLNGSVTYGIPESRVFEFSQGFNEKLTDWCVEKGIVVINPLSKILGKNYLPKNELLQIDGIHLNDTAIKYYINEINKKTGESLIFVPRAQSLGNVLQAGTEPESLSLLVADELGLLWDRTKLPHGTRRQLEDKLIHFISDRLSESGIDISFERDTDYNYHNKLRSIDLVEIYTFASELFGEEINFDVNIRELNTVEKLSDFIYKNKPLTKNDFFESLTQDTSDNIRSLETFSADSRIAAMHDDMYMHFKEIIHLQTEGVNFGYGIIYFWFALIEAKRDNYGLALNLLQNAEDINLRFPFRSLRIENYRNLWEEKLVEQQKELNKRQAKKQNRTRKKYEYSDLWWPEGKFVCDEDDLLLELKYRGKEITEKVKTLYAVGVYDLKKCRLYFDMFKHLTRIYLFMPVPEIYEQLKKSVHNDARIEVFPYALKDTDGYDLLVMDIIDSRLSLNMGKQYNLISGKAISVECRTFEKFIESNKLPLPDMLIFDIRGMEHRFYSSISPKYLSKIKINYFTTSKEAFCYGERSNILLQRLFKEHFEYFGFAPFIKSAEQQGNVLFLNKHDINSILDLHEKQTKILEKEISSSVLKIKSNVVDECIDTDISHEGKVTDSPEEIYQNIQSMVDSGHLEKAFSALEKLIEEFPDYALAHNDLGVLNYNRADKEKALKHYEKAARLEPENIIFQKNLADMYYAELGRVEEAMQIYVKVLNANPEDVETLLIIGHICVALKKFDDAKDFYSRILIIEPWNKDAKQFLEELEKCQLSATGDRLGSEDIETASKEYLVSAIVSTYNSERFIRGCLEDLENQTIADRLEVIVVNSGSEQNEDKIIKEFQKKYSNIKYIKTDKRETVYAAWNRGIKAATGKYITNANTDDRHRKDALEIMANILENQPEIALVYADLIITENENETFENCTPVGYFSWMNWKREDLLNKGCFMGPQPMWRRDVHDEYGYFDDSFVTSGDYEFWLRISQTNTFLHLPVRLGLYLRSPGSIEHTNREKQREENNKIFKMYSESDSSSKNIRSVETDLHHSSQVKINECSGSKEKMIRYQLIDKLIKEEKNAEAMNRIEEAIALYGVDDGILSAAIKIRDLIGPIEIDQTKDKKYTVSLCMIVKNEEEYLARCLKSVKPVVNEMIVVDTGSEDRTIEIARAFGAKVFNFKWTGDFSEARNFSLSKASGNWTFHLDADEVISPLDYEEFGKIIRKSATKRVAFLVNTRNYTMNVNQVGWTANDGHYEKEESATGWTPSEKVRLFHNESNIRFEYPIHELVEPSLKRAGYALKKCKIPVHHYGKLNKEKSDDKRKVYYQTGRKKLDEMGEDIVAIRELAIQAEILGKHDEAIELWERFIAIEPNVPSAYINMGISYCGLGKFEDVLKTAKKAMKLEPDLKEAHYNYALGKLHLGSAAEAVSILEKLLERLGEYPPAQFLSAAAYCCDGQKDKGINILKKLQKTSIGSELPVRCYELAKGFVSSQRHDYAMMLLKAAIESKNSNKKINELYYKCLKMADDNEKTETNGITFCEKLKSTENKSDHGNKVIAIDMIQQAEELNQKGQADNAIEATLKAIGHFPEDKQPYYLLAQILINAKRYKDAFDVLNEMPQNEEDVKRLELAGYCKEGMEQYDEAKAYVTQALSLNPLSATAMNLKGVLAYNQGDNSKAEVLFKKAIEFDPGYGEPYTNLGAIRWKENQDDALKLFEKGFILSPTIPDIITNYHTASSTLGGFERAERIFQDAGSLNPNNKMIKYQLIDMLVKQEKYTKAMHRIEEAIALFGVDDGILSAAIKVRNLLGPKEIGKRKKNTVSLCMIVKNEEKYLARCLNSVKSIVDEMIVVDTGSTERTKDIAKVFGAKVYDFEWNDDFSAARNYSISKASGKWNLIMDADEAISSLDYNKFKKIIERSKPVAYQFTTRNYTLLFNIIGWNANDGKYINENAGGGWTPSDKVRLFPNKPGVRFEYPIHELIEPSLKKAGLGVKKCKIPIHHYGRLNQGESDNKGEIYYQIGRKKLDEMEGNATALIELAIQAGILGKYEESIELWERFINIKPEIPMAFVNMGAIYTKLGKYDKALSAAAKALEIDSDMKEAHYNFAFSKVHLGQVKEAILVLEKLLSRFNEYPPAQFLLSVAYCLEAREAKWRKGFEKLRLTMGPGLAVACHEFAKGLVSAKRLDYAATLLEAAIESKNGNKEIDELYSKCLGMMNVDRKTGTTGN